VPYADVKEQIGHGRANPSLIQALLADRQSRLERGEEAEMTIEDIKGAAGAAYAAGQDTTWSTLVVFISNMLLHPEVQQKAQRVIDDVVERSRLPTFGDRPKLQYIDCVVQETLRWCPVSPVGVPHRNIEDDFYKGYFIPAGSFVYANARAMTHDERVYTSPEEFNPDRFIPKSEGGLGEPSPKGHFGFGRRICVGQHLAEASVWIVVASVLSTIILERWRDPKTGTEEVPVVEFTNGLTSHPKPFRCVFTPRVDRIASLSY